MLTTPKISFFLALRTMIRTGRGASLLTVVIMVLAFLNILIIPSVFFGVVQAMNNEAIDNLFGHIVIEPGEGQLRPESAVLKTVSETPGVIGSSAHTVMSATLVYEPKDQKTKAGDFGIKSIDPEQEKTVTTIYQHMAAGEFLKAGDKDGIIIGKEITGAYGAVEKRRSLDGIGVGNKLTVMFTNGTKRVMIVRGIFATKSIEADLYAFITKDAMDEVLGVTDQATEIIVRINRPGDEQTVIDRLKSDELSALSIKPWKEYAGITAAITESFALINGILSAIGALIATVATFIVIFISVNNKRRQIGILRAIGIKPSIIIGTFMMQALFYAAVGIGIGFAVMYGIITPSFAARPIDFPIGWVKLDVTGLTVMSGVVSLVAAALVGGALPSWRAVRENIINAIRSV